MPVNLVGLGLLVAGLVFLVMGLGYRGGVVLWILGVVCRVGAVGALFLGHQRRRRLAS
jgi:hypothetical protein